MGDRQWVKAVAWGSTIGTTLVVFVGGGYFLGSALDERWQTYPVLTLICMLGGLIFGGSPMGARLKSLGKTILARADIEGDEVRPGNVCMSGSG